MKVPSHVLEVIPIYEFEMPNRSINDQVQRGQDQADARRGSPERNGFPGARIRLTDGRQNLGLNCGRISSLLSPSWLHSFQSKPGSSHRTPPPALLPCVLSASKAVRACWKLGSIRKACVSSRVASSSFPCFCSAIPKLLCTSGRRGSMRRASE